MPLAPVLTRIALTCLIRIPALPPKSSQLLEALTGGQSGRAIPEALAMRRGRPRRGLTAYASRAGQEPPVKPTAPRLAMRRCFAVLAARATGIDGP